MKLLTCVLASLLHGCAAAPVQEHAPLRLAMIGPVRLEQYPAPPERCHGFTNCVKALHDEHPSLYYTVAGVCSAVAIAAAVAVTNLAASNTQQRCHANQPAGPSCD